MKTRSLGRGEVCLRVGTLKEWWRMVLIRGGHFYSEAMTTSPWKWEEEKTVTLISLLTDESDFSLLAGDQDGCNR